MQLFQTADGSYTLRNAELDETYHSKFGARTESDHVFLRNSGVHKRLLNNQPTSILEIGFGTGFNFVHTACHALNHNCPLRYSACEYFPLNHDTALELLIHNAPDSTQLCEFAADAIRFIAERKTDFNSAFNHQTNLCLTPREATTCEWPAETFDAIYLDAFSTKNNPTLWSTEFLRKLHNASKPDAVLATYCVNGSFRHALTEAGFAWQKLPGPKGKREVLVATPAQNMKRGQGLDR